MNNDVKDCIKDIEIEKEYRAFFEKIFERVNSTLFNHNMKETQAAVKAMNRTHRYIQNEIVAFIYNFLKEYGKGAGDPSLEDGRNSWALNWAKKATEIT